MRSHRRHPAQAVAEEPLSNPWVNADYKAGSRGHDARFARPGRLGDDVCPAFAAARSPPSSASVKSIFACSRSTRATFTRTRPASWNVAAAALADERVARRVEVEVVAAELGDVHEAVDVEAVERHEEAEARRRR